MASHNLVEQFPALVLYIVNVQEPCGKSDILAMLEESSTSSRGQPKRLGERLDEILNAMIENRLLALTAENEYFVTPKGSRILSERRLAFPRDKHRLYWLKEAMKGRGQ